MRHGCQIWGADFEVSFTKPELALKNDLQLICLRYLRLVSGATQHVPSVCLLQELKSTSLVYHWLRLFCGFWNQMVEQGHRLLHAVFKLSVHLALQGLKDCWAANV